MISSSAPCPAGQPSFSRRVLGAGDQNGRIAAPARADLDGDAPGR